MSVIGPLRRRVLSQTSLPLDSRLLLVQTLVLTKMFFNACTWASLSKPELEKLERTLLNAYRMLLPRTPLLEVESDRNVKCKFGCPSASLIIARARLLYLPRLVFQGNPLLMSLLHANDGAEASWLQSVRADCSWMLLQCKERLQLPCPSKIGGLGLSLLSSNRVGLRA